VGNHTPDPYAATPDDVAAGRRLAALHRPHPDPVAIGWCVECAHDWPCPQRAIYLAGRADGTTDAPDAALTETIRP
jgi:hypothetical protein